MPIEMDEIPDSVNVSHASALFSHPVAPRVLKEDPSLPEPLKKPYVNHKYRNNDLHILCDFTC